MYCKINSQQYEQCYHKSFLDNSYISPLVHGQLSPMSSIFNDIMICNVINIQQYQQSQVMWKVCPWKISLLVKMVQNYEFGGYESTNWGLGLPYWKVSPHLKCSDMVDHQLLMTLKKLSAMLSQTFNWKFIHSSIDVRGGFI